MGKLLRFPLERVLTGHSTPMHLEVKLQGTVICRWAYAKIKPEIDYIEGLGCEFMDACNRYIKRRIIRT